MAGGDLVALLVEVGEEPVGEIFSGVVGRLMGDKVHRLGDAVQKAGSVLIRLGQAVLLHLKSDLARLYSQTGNEREEGTEERHVID